MAARKQQSDTALLSLRSAVILFLATLIGVLTGIITYWEQHSLAASLIAGGAAWGGSIAVLEKLIGA
jgi:hypothetical protein